jgi:hypothetical protein
MVEILWKDCVLIMKITDRCSNYSSFPSNPHADFKLNLSRIFIWSDLIFQDLRAN